MSGSLSISVNRGSSRIDNATDMLQQYTQATFWTISFPPTPSSLSSRKKWRWSRRDRVNVTG